MKPSPNTTQRADLKRAVEMLHDLTFNTDYPNPLTIAAQSRIFRLYDRLSDFAENGTAKSPGLNQEVRIRQGIKLPALLKLKVKVDEFAAVVPTLDVSGINERGWAADALRRCARSLVEQINLAIRRQEAKE